MPKVSEKAKIKAKKEYIKQEFEIIENEDYDVSDYNLVVKEIGEISDSGELPIRVQRFCDEYVIHYNEEKSAEKAGFPIWNALNVGRQLLSHPRIRREIENRQKKITRKLQITQERVLTEIAAIAYCNMQDFYDPETGELIPIHKLPRHLAAAVEEIQYSRNGKPLRYKLVRKTYGLDAIAKNLGVFDKDADRTLPLEFKQFLNLLPEDLRENIKVNIAKRIENKKNAR